MRIKSFLVTRPRLTVIANHGHKFSILKHLGLLWILSLLGVAGPSVAAQDSEADVAIKNVPADAAPMLNKLRAALPALPVVGVYAAELPGFYMIELDNGQILYSTKDGKYLLAGDLYDIEKGGVNLAEARRNVSRKRLLDAEAISDMVVFSPVGETKTYVNVFTDVDCGYCRKLHQEMAGINARGIEVRYMAYPRAGTGTATYQKIVSAWCADNRTQAMTALKAGLDIPNKQCDNPVDAHYELGQRVGVTGTPAIVTEDGRLLPGYMPAEALAQALGLE